jgi:N-acetylglutamate synthase-like GNAT family acetyltransferase
VTVSFRKATLSDVSTIHTLIAQSAWGLSRADYSDAQIEAALQSAWGVDTQLIRDGTYFVAECGGKVIACGGWSWRGTLFGGDAQAGRRSDALDPSCDAARIRAFFVHPAWARRGLGRGMLEHCEGSARAHGFRSAELVATLPGERLYRVCGYVSQGVREYALPGNQTIAFVPMRKERI